MHRLVACAAMLLFTALPARAEGPPTTKQAELARLSTEALRQAAEGAASASRRTFERILLLDPDHRLARRALGYVKRGGVWTHADAATSPASATSVPEPASVQSLRRALRLAPRATDRAAAATALGSHPDAETRRRLRHAALHDPAVRVRRAALDALVRIDKREATDHFGDLLRASSRATRIRAVEALGRIGDERAAHYVVYRWESVGGRSPRAYFATMAQRSYIQDFDTEVAATSFIADPIVGVVQRGAGLDAKVLSTYRSITTVERAAYVGALEQISGLRLGADVRAWRRWLTREAARRRALSATPK